MDETGSEEDRREAAKLNASLSIGVIAGAATTIAAATALLAFSVGNFRVETSSAIFWAGAFVLLFVSAVLGGSGLRDLMRAGASGDWKAGVGRGYFSGQAVLYVLGVLALAIAAVASFDGPRRGAASEARVEQLTAKTTELTGQVASAEARARAARRRAGRALRRVDALERRVLRISRR